MATLTRQVADRICDHCGRRCPKDSKRVVLGPEGVQEIEDGQTMPTALDLDTACRKSLEKWWQRPRGAT